MSDKTGGPAFPHGPGGDSLQHEDGRVSHQWPAHPGMDLLDWFAGQALQSLVEAESKESHKQLTADGYSTQDSTFLPNFFGDEEPWEEVAKAAYACGSAMLAEKSRREATGKDCSQVSYHSPDAGKMARLEEENRELVEALKSVLDCITETRGPNAFTAVADAKDILAKHQTHKKEAGHE